MNALVKRAYAQRSAEYIELLGSMASVHPSDRQIVTTWAQHLEGTVVDAGCGPGQWTDYLCEIGVDARGVDQVPEFIERARYEYPGRSFELGSLESLDAATGALGGVLSWYSLIHHEPGTIDVPLREFRRLLRPGGGLLIGFFSWPALEPFDHKVTTAYRWPIGELSERVRAAEFEVVETHERMTAGKRPEAALEARAV